MILRGWVATPVGLEPTTSRLEVSRSIQLSYGALGVYPEEYFCPERLRQLPRLIKRDDARTTQAEIVLQRSIGTVDLPRICGATELMR